MLKTVAVLACLALASPAATLAAPGQGRGEGGTHTAQPREPARRPQARRPTPAPHAPSVVLRGHVFIGGYFYDPMFGPYPWWPRTAYPYWYYPVYDNRAELRIIATPKEAAVYVDGFYAGIVDDFDGVFQPLWLTPGGHQIALYFEGFRTVHHNVYLRPGSTLKLHERLQPLPRGVRSEMPRTAPALPPPPDGTYLPPRTMPPIAVPAPGAPSGHAEGFGTLEIRVQPPTASVTIDGERWLSSNEGQYVLQLAPGAHQVEASLEGYRRFSMEVEVVESQSTPINVSLPAAR